MNLVLVFSVDDMNQAEDILYEIDEDCSLEPYRQHLEVSYLYSNGYSALEGMELNSMIVTFELINCKELSADSSVMAILTEIAKSDIADEALERCYISAGMGKGYLSVMDIYENERKSVLEDRE